MIKYHKATRERLPSLSESIKRELTKCLPVVLGGSSLPLGLNKPAAPRACSRLRCIACDFAVCLFDDRRWTAAVDYLFFRNSTPDPVKLGTQLVTTPGTLFLGCVFYI